MMAAAGTSGSIDLPFTVQLKNTANAKVPNTHMARSAEPDDLLFTISLTVSESRLRPAAAKRADSMTSGHLTVPAMTTDASPI